MGRLTFALVSAVGVSTIVVAGQSRFAPTIPQTWDDRAVASLQVPLATASASPIQIPSAYYYGIPVRPIYKSYPVYHPSKEPPRYVDWLERQEPQVVFDADRLKTAADWIAAGELVFDAPIGHGHIAGLGGDLYLRDPRWYQETGAPLARDGTLPFYRYVIRQKGKVEIGLGSWDLPHARDAGWLGDQEGSGQPTVRPRPCLGPPAAEQVDDARQQLPGPAL